MTSYAWGLTSVEDNLRLNIESANDLKTGYTPKTPPIVNAMLFVTDVLIAISNRETRDFLTTGSRNYSPYVRNIAALDNLIRGNGWKRIADGFISEASYREKAALCASIGSAFMLLNTGAVYFSPANVSLLRLSKGLKAHLPFIAGMLQRGMEVTRIGCHGSLLFAEKQEYSEKFSRNTYYETTAKVTSVACSLTALGGIAASWVGLHQVSSILGTASGLFGAIRFLASWKESKAADELLHLQQEMITAFNVFGEEIFQKSCDKVIDNNLGFDKRQELYALRNLIMSLQPDLMGMSASLIAFSKFKDHLAEINYITKETAGKADYLISRLTAKLQSSSIPAPVFIANPVYVNPK